MMGRTRKWICLLIAVIVLGAFATQLSIRHFDLLFTPPTIRGTQIAVPRAWRSRQTPRDWHWIVIHHSASDSGSAATFDQWHRQRGWDELGYHFVIDNGEGLPDGRVEVGGRWYKQKQGAHAKSPSGEYNDRGIGICLVGNFEKTAPTADQWQSLVRLVAYLAREYDIPESRIIAHHDVNSQTLCPGKNLNLEQLRHDVAHIAD